ncbi:MAG: hypothetical protein EOT04_03350 [Candidatus Chaera renei]|uniref:Tetratricopeptide repeat protein n=1 Tax=Candidatus Chaera renei TaxID=2506947 RepID=A0A4V1J7A5_9BACT|nr:MAG: hypothetical protein EOT04_03350 [Candidatus Chaera renei]
MAKLTRKLFKRRRWLLAVAAVLLLAGGGTATYYYLKKQNSAKKLPAVSQPAVQPAATLADLNWRLNKTSDPAAKAKLYADMSSAAMSENKKAESLDYAQKAYQLQQNVDTASKVAGTAQLNGNWALAAEYYKKAADLSPKPADPKENTDYNNYMLLYNEMKAKL